MIKKTRRSNNIFNDVSLGAVTFKEATAPAGTVVYGVRDNTGDLTFNALTGKTINLAIAGTDTIVVGGTLTYLVNGTGLVIGHTAKLTAGGTGATVSEVQVLGTAVDVDTNITIGAFSASAGVAPTLSLVRSKHATLGSNTIVADNDALGVITAFGADGVDFNTQIARIVFEVDDGTPGAGNIGGAIILSTSTTNAVGTGMQERMRISTGGFVGIGRDDASTMLDVRLSSAGTNAISNVITASHITSGSATSGFGAGLVFEVEAANGNAYALARVAGLNGAAGSNQGYMVLQTNNAGTLTTALTIDNSQNATFVGDIAMSSTKKFYLDGGSDTYIYEQAANTVNLVAGGTVAIGYDATKAWIPATNRLYLDGASDTYLVESSANTFDVVVGGTTTIRSTATSVSLAPSTLILGGITYTVPPDDGDAGEQLQTNGSGVLTWEAAASSRDVKVLLGQLSPTLALNRIMSTPIHEFKYRPDAKHVGGDYNTVFTGIVADEAPWAMKHNGRIFNEISAYGHAHAAIQALKAEIDELRAKLNAIM